MAYPVGMGDPAKPPGLMPGMIEGHPALNANGTMKGMWCLELQKTLTAVYVTEEFQKRLYAGWYATDDIIERHKWRQEVCMEVQCRILPEYGFEGNRKGVYASGVACCSSLECRNPEIAFYGNAMQRLVNPDLQEAATEIGAVNWSYLEMATECTGVRPGEDVACEYEIFQTMPGDDHAIFGIARCQGVLAGAHQAMYNSMYPDLKQEDWFSILGLRKSSREALESGVIIYHAMTLDTHRVVGYISCTCFYGNSQEEPYGHINNIVILPQHRGRGLGNKLFHELLDHLANAASSVADDLRISVAAKNLRAKDWYERLGFAPVGDWIVFPGNCKVEFTKMQRKMGADDFNDIFAV